MNTWKLEAKARKKFEAPYMLQCNMIGTIMYRKAYKDNIWQSPFCQESKFRMKSPVHSFNKSLFKLQYSDLPHCTTVRKMQFMSKIYHPSVDLFHRHPEGTKIQILTMLVVSSSHLRQYKEVDLRHCILLYYCYLAAFEI
jgi:hypothetical protein